MTTGACPECGWRSPGADACPRCGLPRLFAEAQVGPPLGERLAAVAQGGRDRIAAAAEGGRERLAGAATGMWSRVVAVVEALRGWLPGPRRVLLAALTVALAGAAWRWGLEAWARARPVLVTAWAEARTRLAEATAPAPEVSAGAQVLTLEVVLPAGVATTRAKLRLVPTGKGPETVELDRLESGRYRVELPVPRDPDRPVALGVGFQGGKARKYRWRCSPGELGTALTLDVARARSGEGCWEELRK